jgi:WbqC-like protein family
VPTARPVIAILQPGYLPWLGFFEQMCRADVFVYYDDVQYDKHGWRNRNRIKTPQGPLWLTVPARHRGLGFPRILDVEIDNRRPWARKHVASIRYAYARAPYVEQYMRPIDDVLSRGWKRLVDLDVTLAGVMAAMFGIAPRVVRSSELGIHGERSDRLLRICQHFAAATYLSGDAARDYLDVALFERHRIAVEWQQFTHPVYPQQHGEFIPYLSALDLLLNCGPESRRVLDRRREQSTTSDGEHAR